MTNFGATVKRHLENRGHTQSWLAQMLGINPSSLSHAVSGTRHPKAQLVWDIAEALALSAQEGAALFISAGYPHPSVADMELPPSRLSEDMEQKSNALLNKLVDCIIQVLLRPDRFDNKPKRIPFREVDTATLVAFELLTEEDKAFLKAQWGGDLFFTPSMLSEYVLDQLSKQGYDADEEICTLE